MDSGLDDDDRSLLSLVSSPLHLGAMWEWETPGSAPLASPVSLGSRAGTHRHRHRRQTAFSSISKAFGALLDI
jgi:hypothetical protein